MNNGMLLSKKNKHADNKLVADFFLKKEAQFDSVLHCQTGLFFTCCLFTSTL